MVPQSAGQEVHFGVVHLVRIFHLLKRYGACEYICYCLCSRVWFAVMAAVSSFLLFRGIADPELGKSTQCHSELCDAMTGLTAFMIYMKENNEIEKRTKCHTIRGCRSQITVSIPLVSIPYHFSLSLFIVYLRVIYQFKTQEVLKRQGSTVTSWRHDHIPTVTSWRHDHISTVTSWRHDHILRHINIDPLIGL